MNEMVFAEVRPDLTLALVLRIRDVYRTAIQQAHSTGDSIWNVITNRNLGIHDLMMGDDIESLRHLLSDPGQTDLFYGFDDLFLEELANRSHLSTEQTGAYFAFHLGLLTKLGNAL